MPQVLLGCPDRPHTIDRAPDAPSAPIKAALVPFDLHPPPLIFVPNVSAGRCARLSGRSWLVGGGGADRPASGDSLLALAPPLARCVPPELPLSTPTLSSSTTAPSAPPPDAPPRSLSRCVRTLQAHPACLPRAALLVAPLRPQSVRGGAPAAARPLLILKAARLLARPSDASSARVSQVGRLDVG